MVWNFELFWKYYGIYMRTLLRFPSMDCVGFFCVLKLSLTHFAKVCECSHPISIGVVELIDDIIIL